MHSFALNMGANLKGGELIELVSDLGGGKTTFVKGLAEGAGSKDHVSSPSFTIRNDYSAKGFSIAHFDFYRLNEAGIIKDMLEEVMGDESYVTIIEWGSLVKDALPENHIQLIIQVVSETERRIKINCPAEFVYLLKGINR